MRNYTDINIVLDRSGSMASIKDDTIGGLNTFVDDQKAVEGCAKLTLVQFDNKYECVVEAEDIQKVGPLTFTPRGGTALLDAVGRCINETRARLEALPKCEQPKQVIFVIITDGQENSSREFGHGQIKAIIEQQREQHQWEFVFLGANQDAFAEAASIGIFSNVANFGAQAGQAKHAYHAVSKGITGYRGAGVATSSNILAQDVDAKGNIIVPTS